MARSLSGADLRLLNANELNSLFFDLKSNVQMKIVNAALRKSGKIILDEAKSNFQATKKGKSKTGYSALKTAFQVRPRQKETGVIVGMVHKEEGFKYRFLNFGTEERYTRRVYKTGKKKFTGIIKPSNFFTNAVKSKGEQAQGMVIDEIQKKFESVLAKYNKG